MNLRAVLVLNQVFSLLLRCNHELIQAPVRADSVGEKPRKIRRLNHASPVYLGDRLWKEKE